MKKTNLFKYRFIKKYEVDLWGYLTACSNEKHFFKKMFKVFCYKYKPKIKFVRYLLKKFFKTFIYSTNMPKKIFRKKFKKDYLIYVHTLLNFRVYYGDLTIKKFKKFVKKINKRRVDFISKISFLLESRLDILLYRLNLFKNPREARQFIKHKKVLVNGVVRNTLNFQLYLNDCISLDSLYKKRIFLSLKKKLKEKKILFNYPRFLEVNYKLLKCIFIAYPRKNDIPVINRMDLKFLRNLK